MKRVNVFWVIFMAVCLFKSYETSGTANEYFFVYLFLFGCVMHELSILGQKIDFLVDIIKQMLEAFKAYIK